MVEFSPNIIQMSRGDKVAIDLTIFTPKKNIYQPETGETTKFIVRNKIHNTPDAEIIFTKEFSQITIDGTNYFYGIIINPDDTYYLKTGKLFFNVVFNGNTITEEIIAQGTLYIIN